MSEPDLGRFEPTSSAGRNPHLDAVRGIATLGTFFVSAIAYGLPHAAFFNLSSPGNNGAFDWLAAYVGEVFVDQKATALIAMLFGAGLMLFSDRATAAGRRPRRTTLWRSFGLFWIGVPVGMHGLLWEGTSLFFLAFLTPLLILFRNKSSRTLLTLGGALMVFAAALAVLFQTGMPDDINKLGQYWITGAHGTDDETVALMYIPLDIFIRLLGSTLIGMGLCRVGILQGTRSVALYRWIATVGLAVGIPLAVASIMWRELGDYSKDVAMAGEAPNTLAAIPMALGYASLIVLWGKRSKRPGSTAALVRVRAVGQMALTNSILQTVFGIIILRDGPIGRGELSRTGIVGVVTVVWATQLLWSKPWLERFRFGPAEWLIRSFTYRSKQPFRL